MVAIITPRLGPALSWRGTVHLATTSPISPSDSYTLYPLLPTHTRNLLGLGSIHFIHHRKVKTLMEGSAECRSVSMTTSASVFG